MSARTYFNGFGFPREGGGSCKEGNAGLDCQKKKTNLVAIYVLLFFAAIKICSAMLPIYYGISSSTLCQMSGLKVTFKNVSKHKTTFKLEF